MYCGKEINSGKNWHESCRLTYCEDLLARIQHMRDSIKGLPRKVWEAMHRDNFIRDQNSPDFKIRILTPEELERRGKSPEFMAEIKNVLTQVFPSSEP